MKILLIDALHTLIIKGEGIFTEMEALLDSYSNRKIILTNADDEQMKEYGFLDLPYDIFTLKHKPDKVNPLYFERLLEHFDLSPADVLYIEHNVDAIKSAERLGITAYHYDAELKDLENLKEFIDSYV